MLFGGPLSFGSHHSVREKMSHSQHRQCGTLRVGTAGWTKDQWRGPFYLPGARSGEEKLDAYQQHLRTVENNGTCHSTPSKEAAAKWKARCGKGFQMATKMVKYVTHERGSPDSDEALDALRTFADNVAGLGDNLGPILFQFPRTKKVSATQLRKMDKVLKQSNLPRDVKIAVEIRHCDSIRDTAVLDELRSLRWCLVAHPNSVGRGTVIAENREGRSESHGLDPVDGSWPITAVDWVYVRLHGANDEHSGRYSDADLKCQAVPAICHWLRNGIDVYVYILCDDDSAGMPDNAKSLERLCHKELGTSVPRAPKQVMSIASFFGTKASVGAGGKRSTTGGVKEDANKKRREEW
jgi:uncharacterized protein YecE (DUF72 family)